MKTKRGYVHVNLGLIEEGMKLDELQTIIDQARERIASEGIDYNVTVDVSNTEGYYGSVTTTISLSGYRFETDEEWQLREEQQHKSSVARSAERRRMYEQLKREFEDE